MGTVNPHVPHPNSTPPTSTRDLVIVTDPCAVSNPRLVAAAVRAGACGVLDLVVRGEGPDRAADPVPVGDQVAEVARRVTGQFGVRLPAGVEPDRVELPDQVDTLILTGPLPSDLPGLSWGERRVLVEVVSRAEAETALEAGAAGLVAKGCESGGRVGDIEGFVLAQQIAQLGVPFWVQGGIGEHTAAAAVAAGAHGVVLDGQLALTRESCLGDDARAAVLAMDGSETRLVGQHRVYVRPDLPAASLPEDTSPETVIGMLGADLHKELLPLGQDAATASRLARRHMTVGGVVQAVRQAMSRQVALAAEHQPLAPESGIAARHGIRHPVVQGPMTRVSDQAAFAAAVAEAGGLPFLALALMSSADTRSLLAETAELLGDRPWGVGILGFVPADVRAAQLDAIHDVRPPAALIAGGRPSQAQPLEEAGITTYLHVPSPGLLDRFLGDGARRFVFEGRECGGHVGPRASLPLWEAQLERLLEVDDPENLDVLFAGGIHDARSSAMVAAIAAPLASRGAHVGVLMGTAYLFTEEAVASGAITPGYQEAARGCERTVLLETSPGHATRCVETDYVRAFSARKAELEAAGVPAKEAWAELETLNLGRLRMASKGLRREGDQLVDVDQEAQRREGMYMIGQVASLREELTTVADLHEDVTTGAASHLEDLAAPHHRLSPQARERTQPQVEPVDVAVVGMSAVFPGAADIEQYWANVVDGVDCVTEVPSERWDAATFYDEEALLKDAGIRTPSKWGGFLPWVPFNALAYGIPPRSLASIETVQLLGLEVVARALADAGYDRRDFDRRRTSVIFGAEGGNDLAAAYGFRAGFPHFVGALPPELDQHIPTLTEDSFPGVLVNVIAGRIANRLDLGGVNYTVDAACAASLAALDIACKELAAGTSDLVLCGAADVHNGINDYLLFASAHALSPQGQCRTFDASADGIVLGEGVACVALKRLADAERDGDQIYAVIEAVAGSSDGRHLGLTAPRKEGQVLALLRAHERAGVEPSTIGLVEAHGTGTVVGDRTELATLTDVFKAGGAPAGATVIGSVKSQIGHTKCAAGLAGLIKAVQAVYTGTLPPTRAIETPNGYYDADASPFRFLDRAIPWPAAERRSGISAFGFGGTNFHVVLRSHPDDDRPKHGLHVWPAELFLVRAKTAEAGRDRVVELSRKVAAIAAADPSGERHQLRDLARTVCELGTGRVRCALVADDLGDLATKLAAAADGQDMPGVFHSWEGDLGPDPKLAFLYPGQGSQRPHMLADLFVAFPHLQTTLSSAQRWAGHMFPEIAFTAAQRQAQAEALTDTRVAQPALGLAALAITRLLSDLGVDPDMAGGHSYGELAALRAAGVFDDATLLALSEARGQAMVAAAEALGEDMGAMAAVSLPAGELQARLGQDVVLANHNGPAQTVVSGPTAAIDAFVAELAADRIGAKRLPVGAAFHSPLIAGASADLAAALEEAEVSPPNLPVWSNATAGPYPEDARELRSLAAGQLERPVLFVEQIESMYEAGARVFVEAGPGRVLTQLVDRILGDRPHAAVCCDAPAEPGLRRLVLALAELAAAGVPVDPAPLFRERAERLDLAALPLPAPGWRLNGSLIRTRDGQPLPHGLQPADHIPEVTMNDLSHPNGPGSLGTAPPAGPATATTEGFTATTPGSSATATPEDRAAAITGRDAVLLEYLRTGQRVADNQRDVMLSYLGEPLPASRSGPEAPPEALDVPARAASLTAGTYQVEPGSGNGSQVAAAGPGVDDGSALRRGSHDLTDESTGSDGDGSAGDGQHPAKLSGEEMLSAVTEVVGDQTGYPLDMLDPDLDLEADLSIDSIKRLEILGELADRVGLPGVDAMAGVDEAIIEELAQLKTLRTIVTWIEDHASDQLEPAPALAGDAQSAAARPGGDASTSLSGGTPGPESTAPPLPPTACRYRVEQAPLTPALPVRSLNGQTFAVVSDSWDGLEELSERLEGAGATIELLPVHRDAPNPVPEDVAALLGEVDGIVHLGAAEPHAPVDARDVFAMLAPALTGRATTLVAVSAPATDPLSTIASGVAGMMRSLSWELPDRLVRAVELPAGESPEVRARLLADEVLDQRGPASVTYRDGARATPQVTEDALTTAETDEEPHDMPLDAGSVAVITGGARGITARAAVALARATGCRLELLGRSPLPDDEEDPRTASAPDRPALRRTLADLGELRTPAEIEAACDRILAAREIRATLASLQELDVPTVYHQVDVRNEDELIRALEDIRSRHGRIDAIVHGAGVLDDHLARDKTGESFDRVFGTKVDAARTLLSNLGTDVNLLVFFSSVSGVFGNRGQVDYSAANDAQDELARRFDGTAPDGAAPRRVLSIDWGPWGGTGMVSPELEREYARRGIGLVDPDEGVRILLEEMPIAQGGSPQPRPSQLVVMRARPEVLGEGEREVRPAPFTGPPSTPEPAAGDLTLEGLTSHG